MGSRRANGKDENNAPNDNKQLLDSAFVGYEEFC